ncbi:MAG TPA: hypothetical protein VF515_12780 [Candidatus Binatia bacterium]
MKTARSSASSPASRAAKEQLVAARFTVCVPKDRRLTLAIPLEIEPGEAEVIVLHRGAKPTRERAPLARITHHPAFGLWAKRAEVADPVAFVEEIRRRVMEKRTAR